MKNYKKGFIIPIVWTIVVLLTASLGTYVYVNQHSKVSQTNQVENNVATISSISTQEEIKTDKNKCVPENGRYAAPLTSEDLCCEGLVEKPDPQSQSGTMGTCVKPTNQTTSRTNPTELTPQIILNSSYDLGGEGILKFKDGQFNFAYIEGKGNTNQIQNYPDPSFSASIDKNNIIFGDFSGDGVNDAVIIEGEQYGGTGYFMNLVALKNVGGHPIVSGVESLGDRQVIKSLKIQNKIITIDYLTQGENDGMCCASEPVHATYKVDNGKLIKISEIKTAPVPTQSNTSNPVFNIYINKVSSQQNQDFQFHPGNIITITGSGFYVCKSVNNCELEIKIGNTLVPLTPSNTTSNSQINFTAPQINPGTYELYLYNIASGDISNAVQVTIL